jgi:hypothetical protein
MIRIVLLALSFSACVAAEEVATRPSARGPAISYETQAVRLTVSRGGEVLGLVDRRSGVDYADHAGPIPLAVMRSETGACPATAAETHGDRLRLAFGPGRTAELRIEVKPLWFTLQVVGVSSRDSIKSLDLIDLPLTLKAEGTEPLAACVLALNLQTNVVTIPQASRRLQATCYSRFCMPGAKAAVIVCPPPQLREVMKQVVLGCDELPHSPMGGPWALDAPANRGSYIIDCTGKTGEGQIDAWIDLLRTIGINQLDIHCGACLRFGDYTPNPEVHPRGLASVRAMNDKLHKAGMLAGLHTYAFFIAKDSPFVTPVPDRGLAADTTYTLAQPLTADATDVTIVESTANASTVTGFQIRNSVTLRVDDELITYKGVRKEPPFGFLECQRGAHGTRRAAHATGAVAKHLKECFGLFVPDPESALFTEVVARTARAYNEGGFDMIYLDALDGSDILGGHEAAWYYGSKFVFDLARRLTRPALFEMSTFHHHLWIVRSRMGAWDAPARGARSFIEIHRRANEECARCFLPAHLGWWAVFGWQGIQPERTFPETIEYLCCRCLADGCGLSFLASSPPEVFGKTNRRFGQIIRRYEDLRRSDTISADLRRRLGVPGDEYTLEASPGAPGFRFRPVRYDKHRIGRVAPAGNVVAARNPFGAQPLAVRIEALVAMEDYDSPRGTVIEDFSDPSVFSERRVPAGMVASLARTTDRVRGGSASGHLAVTSRPAGNPTWAMLGRKFSPSINLTNKGLGFWVYGDGKGQVLNVQMRSPASAHGGLCERYARIDFAGWRYLELIEPESDDIPRHDWPYLPGGTYPLFHIWVSYDKIDELNLWLGDLPAGGACCDISPIRALPLKLCALRNPTITVNGKTIRFPAELQSGQYLECRSANECEVYDAEGTPIARIDPLGDWPDLQPGDNTITFKAEPASGRPPRAAVTLITRGEPLPGT